jgi:hypothetical protein
MDSVWYRLVLFGRALYFGTLWGAVFGGVTWMLVCVASAAGGGIAAMMFVPVACSVGGVVGGAIGSVAGLALAISSRRVLQPMYRAQLITGSVSAAAPVTVALWVGRPGSLVAYLIAVVIGGVAALTAMLLTPRIVDGPPQRRYG